MSVSRNKPVFSDGSYLDVDENNKLTYVDSTGVKRFSIDPATGKITLYATVASAAFGMGEIVAGGVQQHKTNAAPVSLTFAPPSAAGTYLLLAVLSVKTATAIAFKLKATYADVQAGAVTDAFNFQVEGSTVLTAAPAAADRFTALPLMVQIDATGTNIVMADNAGTYTTCEYYYTPFILRLA